MRTSTGATWYMSLIRSILEAFTCTSHVDNYHYHHHLYGHDECIVFSYWAKVSLCTMSPSQPVMYSFAQMVPFQKIAS